MERNGFARNLTAGGGRGAIAVIARDLLPTERGIEADHATRFLGMSSGRRGDSRNEKSFKLGMRYRARCTWEVGESDILQMSYSNAWGVFDPKMQNGSNVDLSQRFDAPRQHEFRVSRSMESRSAKFRKN